MEGGEAGTEWSEAEWSTGAKRTPEQARRHLGGFVGGWCRNAQIYINDIIIIRLFIKSCVLKNKKFMTSLNYINFLSLFVK